MGFPVRGERSARHDESQMLASMSRSIRTTTGFASAVLSTPCTGRLAHHARRARAEAAPLLPDTEDGLSDYLAR